MTDSELLARLEKLERDNRRLKKFGVAGMVLMGALALAAWVPAAAVVLIAVLRPTPNVVKAHKFEVMDGQGRARITLLVTGSGKDSVTGLNMIGADGKPDVELLSNANTSSLLLGGNTPHKYNPAPVVLGVAKGNPSLELSDGKGVHASINAFSVGPSVSLTDGQGYSTEIGTANLVTTKTGETHQTSADSIVMFGSGKKHKVIWQAP